jgi:hypothetical protein
MERLQSMTDAGKIRINSSWGNEKGHVSNEK